MKLFLIPDLAVAKQITAFAQTNSKCADIDWVEKSTPPDSITATGRAFPGRSRPLCAYPTHAQCNGTGDPENAANYSCRP